MAMMYCPECGKEISDNANVCPECGYEIVQQDDHIEELTREDIQDHKNKKYVGIALLVIACICFIVAFKRIKNDDYSFYSDHYKECMEGYADTKSTANSYSGYFGSIYDGIASDYEDMAKEDNIILWEYRIQALLLCACGITCVIVGYKKYKEGS